MTLRFPGRGRPPLVFLALAVLLLGFVAVPAAGQEPVPPDTIPAGRDTIQVPIPPERLPPDTIPVRPEVAADTVLPAANLPLFPQPAPQGFAAGEWAWTREDLRRFHGLSVLELLEQVPALTVIRAGSFGRPAGVTAFGVAGGRLRVFLDGFELDPLRAATLDLQHIAVADLESLRVVRTLQDVRVDLHSFRLPDARAYTEIEGGTGPYQTRLLRGLFSRPLGARSVLLLGYDVVDTRGWLWQEPFSANNLIARWSYAVNPTTGVQLEFRQAGVDRGGAPFQLAGDRRDMIFRARTQPSERLVIDGMVGHSGWNPAAADTFAPALGSYQGGVRAIYDLPRGWVTASARARNPGRTGFAAPTLDLSAEGGLRGGERLALHGGLRYASTDGIGGVEVNGGARLGPLAGLSLFANAAAGTRGVGITERLVIQLPEETERLVDGRPVIDTVFVDTFLYRFPAVPAELRGFRVGAEWTRWGINAGAAYVNQSLDRVVPFALASDLGAPAVGAEPISGIETFFSVPLLYRPLRLEGWYTYWIDIGRRPYLPEEEARVALTFNQQFYEGNLEPTFRIETVYRGRGIVPMPDPGGLRVVSDRYALLNLFLQIRILDVQAFIVWENLLHDVVAADIPGRPFGGQRAIYGIRWHFFD